MASTPSETTENGGRIGRAKTSCEPISTGLSSTGERLSPYVAFEYSMIFLFFRKCLPATLTLLHVRQFRAVQTRPGLALRHWPGGS
jgi:hypothetical protein